MMGHKEVIKDYDEACAIWGKQQYLYLGRSKVAHRIKKRLSRRNRHKEKCLLLYTVYDLVDSMRKG